MKSVFARVDITTTPLKAKALGKQAAAAARYSSDPACFEDIPNPYGVDSEPELWSAWQDAYENEFELNR